MFWNSNDENMSYFQLKADVELAFYRRDHGGPKKLGKKMSTSKNSLLKLIFYFSIILFIFH